LFGSSFSKCCGQYYVVLTGVQASDCDGFCDVSREVALQVAAGARVCAGVDVAIAATGMKSSGVSGDSSRRTDGQHTAGSRVKGPNSHPANGHCYFDEFQKRWFILPIHQSGF